MTARTFYEQLSKEFRITEQIHLRGNMTDFVAETRHYCRNPRCRSKLPAPVTNAREAFCTRGCHRGFYRTRCLVCEAKMGRRTENAADLRQTSMPQRFAGTPKPWPLPMHRPPLLTPSKHQ